MFLRSVSYELGFLCTGGSHRGKVMWWGTIVGFAVGAWLSYSFILPTDVLNLKLVTITISDLLRILPRGRS
jgi:hypothetical protein